MRARWHDLYAVCRGSHQGCDRAGANAVALRGTSPGRRPGASLGGGAEQPHIFCLARIHTPQRFRRHRTSPCDSSPHRRREQHLRPLAPGLPRRPYSAAYGLGPSMFTIPAIRKATDRASVSQAVACRGSPPLPAMSLGTCRCCRGKQNSGGRGELGLDPAEPGLRAAGVPPPERSAGGGSHPAAR